MPASTLGRNRGSATPAALEGERRRPGLPLSGAYSDPAHREAVARVVGALKQNTDVLLKLSEMAKIALLSRFHFERLFRRFTGMPPRQFQSALRIADAKRLLLTSDMSALDVCLSVGYSSLGTFTRRFAAMVGTSPTGLRRLRSEEPRPAQENRKTSCDQNVVDVAEQRSGSVTGRLSLLPDFDGIAVVGLYRTPSPQGEPLACSAVTPAAPEFAMAGLCDGDYYVLAAAIAKPSDRLSLLLPEVMAVGREAVHVEANKTTLVDICLRPLEITDPPILTALAPYVLKQFLASADSHSILKTGQHAEQPQFLF